MAADVAPRDRAADTSNEPDQQEAATQLVIRQAELMAEQIVSTRGAGLPVVGSEGRGGQAFFVVEVGSYGVHFVAVADGDGLGNFRG